MSDPTIQAASELLEDSLGAMRAAIVSTPPDALNRRPAGEETNSIAVLAVHSMHSTRMWLSVAMGVEPPDRDRPSEFLAEFAATAGGVDDLLASFDDLAGQVRALLAAPGAAFDPGAVREARTIGGVESVTGAYALMHALEHLREHVAHMQLSLQVLGADQAP